MKRIIVLFMMLILSVVLVGCSNESEKEKDDSELLSTELTNNDVDSKEKKMDINYKIGIMDVNNHVDYFGNLFEVILVNEVDELNTYLLNENNNFKKYDEQFFKNNSLIIYNIRSNKTGNKINIKNLFISGTDLFLELELIEGYGDAFSFGIVALEVEKKDCQNIKNVKILK